MPPELGAVLNVVAAEYTATASFVLCSNQLRSATMVFFYTRLKVYDGCSLTTDQRWSIERRTRPMLVAFAKPNTSDWSSTAKRLSASLRIYVHAAPAAAPVAAAVTAAAALAAWISMHKSDLVRTRGAWNPGDIGGLNTERRKKTARTLSRQSLETPHFKVCNYLRRK